MRTTIVTLTAALLSASGCSAPVEDASESTSTTSESLNGVSGAGVAWIRWYNPDVAVGNITTAYSHLWTTPISTSGHYPFQAVRGCNVGSGNGSLFTYELNATTGLYRLRAKRTNSTGQIVAEYPFDLPAPNNATHLTRTGWYGSSDQYFFLNNSAHTGTFYSYTYNSTTQTYSGGGANSLWNFSSLPSAGVVTGYPGDVGVLLYNTTTGQAFRGRADIYIGSPWYNFVSLGFITDELGQPYTHVAFNGSAHVFYNMHASRARLVRWQVSFPSGGTHFEDFLVEDRLLRSPGISYTNLVATTNGKAFFYNTDSGNGATLDLAPNAWPSHQSGFGTGWTVITPVE